MTTREEFVDFCVECLTDEECVKVLAHTKEELEHFDTLKWDMTLETAYNLFLSASGMTDELEEDEEEKDVDDEYVAEFNKNTYCDTFGVCGGPQCPNYYECH